MARFGASSVRPVRVAVVVPGKLDVLARAPHRRLKIVVLPVLGFPIRTTRGSVSADSTPGERGAAAVAGTSGPLGLDRDHVDLVGHRAGQADPRGPDLDDAGLTVLADAELAGAGQAERTQKTRRRAVEGGLVEPAQLAGAHFAERDGIRLSRNGDGIGRNGHGEEPT